MNNYELVFKTDPWRGDSIEDNTITAWIDEALATLRANVLNSSDNWYSNVIYSGDTLVVVQGSINFVDNLLIAEVIKTRIASVGHWREKSVPQPGRTHTDRELFDLWMTEGEFDNQISNLSYYDLQRYEQIDEDCEHLSEAGLEEYRKTLMKKDGEN
jgi:hypothetical protein